MLEPKVGGRWYEVAEDGSECDWGKVLVWDPPRRLSLTWQINGDFEPDTSAITEVEVTFTQEGEATRVDLEHRGFENYVETGQALHDAVSSDHGWGGLLTEFAKGVEAVAVPLKRYFVCKLVLPRPTFIQDMTEEEGALIGAHAAYWGELIKDGRAVLFGPVGDPAGPWGLGILQVEDEQVAKRIAEADPAVIAGAGIRHEVYPMLRTVMRE